MRARPLQYVVACRPFCRNYAQMLLKCRPLCRNHAEMLLNCRPFCRNCAKMLLNCRQLGRNYAKMLLNCRPFCRNCAKPCKAAQHWQGCPSSAPNLQLALSSGAPAQWSPGQRQGLLHQEVAATFAEHMWLAHGQHLGTMRWQSALSDRVCFHLC